MDRQDRIMRDHYNDLKNLLVFEAILNTDDPVIKARYSEKVEIVEMYFNEKYIDDPFRQFSPIKQFAYDALHDLYFFTNGLDGKKMLKDYFSRADNKSELIIQIKMLEDRLAELKNVRDDIIKEEK